jgi:hypothetical protein
MTQAQPFLGSTKISTAVFKRHIEISTKSSTEDYILRIFGPYGNFYGCFQTPYRDSIEISPEDYILRIFGLYGNFYGCF